MADGKQFTPEEIHAILRETVQTKGGDNFRIRVGAKARPADLPSTLGVLEQAAVDHIVYAETWLPMLFGGAGPHGSFILAVYHASDTSKMIGAPIVVPVPGSPITPTRAVLDDKEWKGPPAIFWLWSDNAKKGTRPPGPIDSYGAATPSPEVPPTLPPGAPQSPSGVGASGGHTSVTSPPGNDYVQLAQHAARLEAQLVAEKVAREQGEKTRVVELRLVEAEREAREARAAADRARVEAEARIANSRPQKDITEIVAAIAGAIAPIVGPILSSMQASKQAEVQAMRDIASAERESTKAMLAQQTEMMKLTMQKDESGVAKMLTPMIQSMGVMSQTMTSNMMAMAEIQSMNRVEDEPTALKVVREIGRGISALAAHSARQQAQSRMAAAGEARRQLPAHQPPAQAQPQPQPQAHRGANGNGAFVPPAQRPPTPPPAQAEPAAFAGVEEEEQGDPTVIDQVEEMIRAEEDPKEIARLILQNLNDADVRSELEAHDGNITALFETRLGDWLAEDPTVHAEFAGKVLQTVYEMAEQSGIPLVAMAGGGVA